MSVSRYANVGQAIWTAPDGSQVPYLLRRLLPAPGTLATAGLHQVQLGERIDTIANSDAGRPHAVVAAGRRQPGDPADPARRSPDASW